MTTPLYTTVTAVKALLDSNQASRFGTTYDSIFSSMIATASREIDAHLKRKPGAFAVSVATTRYFKGSGSLQQWVGEITAVPTTVSVAESGLVDNANGTGGTYTAYTANDYLCWPPNALEEGMPYRRLDLNTLIGTKSIWQPYPNGVKVLATFGFSTTAPEEIVKATSIQALRYWKRASQAFADVGAIPELQQLRYVKKLDPDVEQIIGLAKFATSWI